MPRSGLPVVGDVFDDRDALEIAVLRVSLNLGRSFVHDVKDQCMRCSIATRLSQPACGAGIWYKLESDGRVVVKQRVSEHTQDHSMMDRSDPTILSMSASDRNKCNARLQELLQKDKSPFTPQSPVASTSNRATSIRAPKPPPPDSRFERLPKDLASSMRKALADGHVNLPDKNERFTTFNVVLARLGAIALDQGFKLTHVEQDSVNCLQFSRKYGRENHCDWGYSVHTTSAGLLRLEPQSTQHSHPVGNETGCVLPTSFIRWLERLAKISSASASCAKAEDKNASKSKRSAGSVKSSARSRKRNRRSLSVDSEQATDSSDGSESDSDSSLSSADYDEDGQDSDDTSSMTNVDKTSQISKSQVSRPHLEDGLVTFLPFQQIRDKVERRAAKSETIAFPDERNGVSTGTAEGFRQLAMVAAIQRGFTMQLDRRENGCFRLACGKNGKNASGSRCSFKLDVEHSLDGRWRARTRSDTVVSTTHNHSVHKVDAPASRSKVQGKAATRSIAPLPRYVIKLPHAASSSANSSSTSVASRSSIPTSASSRISISPAAAVDFTSTLTHFLKSVCSSSSVAAEAPVLAKAGLDSTWQLVKLLTLSTTGFEMVFRRLDSLGVRKIPLALLKKRLSDARKQLGIPARSPRY